MTLPKVKTMLKSCYVYVGLLRAFLIKYLTLHDLEKIFKLYITCY